DRGSTLSGRDRLRDQPSVARSRVSPGINDERANQCRALSSACHSAADASGMEYGAFAVLLSLWRSGQKSWFYVLAFLSPRLEATVCGSSAFARKQQSMRTWTC